MKRSCIALSLASAAGLAMSGAAVAQTVHPEVEPNDNKATANGIFTLAPGDMIRGSTQGSSTSGGGGADSADYYLIKTPSAPLGIYKHRISVDLANTTVSIRGLTQSNGVPNTGSDAQIQTGTTVAGVARTIQWYGFGREEQMYLRVTGTASALGDYNATYAFPEQVFPTNLGTFQGGDIEITTKGFGATHDTKLWVFDSSLNAIPNYGNVNQPAPGDGVRSRLTRNFAPGTYYLAVGINNIAVEVPAATDDRLLSSAMTESPIVVPGSTTTNANVTFATTDQYGPVVTQASIPTGNTNVLTVLWYEFTVGAVTENLGACCLPDGTCAIQRDVSCTARGGIFSGVASTCGSTPCNQPGACCVQMEGCLTRNESQCTTLSGVYSGHATSCGAVPCSTPVRRVETFAPDSIENYSTQATGFQASFVGFDGAAVFSSTAGGNNINITGGWGFACSISGSALGSSRIAACGNGGFQIDFTTPVKNFGAYLGGNSADGFLCFIDFYDASGQLGTTSAIFDNDCGWNFNAFEFSVPVTKIVMRSNRSNSAYVMVALPQVVFHTTTPPCYANCDGSNEPPILNVADFGCFLGKYAAGDSYANCDLSTEPPVLNVADFGCFLQKYAAGCR